jgi:CSLREA domain-containing protein
VSLAFRRTCLLAALALLATFAPLARPALAAPYSVNSLADAPDAVPGDGTCETVAGNGICTLRAAIMEANASPGADTIPFSVVGTIALTSALPSLSDQSGVTIDGSSVGGVPTIEISGGGGGSVTDGIQIFSSNNTVRGLIINGFSGAGIAISASVRSATNNTVEQNYIGTNPAGNAAGAAGLNNSSAGIHIRFGASSNTINNNVISGNAGYGVFVHTLYSSSTTIQQSNTISNNRIGVTADGSTELGNQQAGVYIGDNSNDNVIGPGNVISANGPTGSTTVYGVSIGGRLLSGTAFISGNRVIGNRIGTNAAGTEARPNAVGGVYVGQSNNTAIGGPNGNAGTPGGDGNLISGNLGRGIDIQDDSLTGSGIVGAVVQNNWIGVDATGNAALGNSEAGVILWKQASGVTIGPNNVISGNQSYGVWLLGARNQANPALQTRNNLITGNSIGTGADGTTAVPNGRYGIILEGGTTGNGIGNSISGNFIRNNASAGIHLATDNGDTPLSPTSNTFTNNQINNNNTTGIELLDASSNNIIGPGNTITDHTVSGVAIATSQNTVIGNTISGNQTGINITNAATGNTIGGPNLGEGNNLINNTGDGVLVSGLGTINNKITHTTTNGNGGKGIALDAGGNAPMVGASLSGLALSGTSLSGAIANPAACGGSCTIEVFTYNSRLDLDIEGPAFVTSFPSAGSFSGIALPNCQPYLIFTITDSAGSTSEFTNPIGPFDQCVPSVPPAPIVTLSDATPATSQGALPGASATFHHTVANTGTATGTLSITHASAWATTLDTTACPSILAAGSSCGITLTVTVPAGAAPGDSNDTTITAALTGAAASAQKIDHTIALSAPSLTFTPLTQEQTVGSGQPVTYEHSLTNTGNGPDSFDITVTPPVSWTFTIQPSGPIALAQGASMTVTVVLTPPPATPASTYPATIRATSHSLASVFKDVTDTTIIEAAAVPQISSVVTPASADPGTPVTIAYTVANVGNQDGTFSLSFTPPPNWIVAQGAPVTVTVPFSGPPAMFSVIFQVPGSAIAGEYPASLTATATSAPIAMATKTDQITVSQKAALTLDPPTFDDLTLRAPSTVVTYTNQLLTNSGNFTDTIHLEASTDIAGWSAQPVSDTVTLNPGASTPITVVLTIPLGQLAGVQNTTTVTATSSLPAVSDSSLITTTVDAVSGALFTPKSLIKVVDAGKPITFTYTLANSGSITQSYTLTQSGTPSGWTSTLTPASPTPTLAPGATLSVTLVLQAPAGTPDNSPGTVTITAACVEKACPNETATAQLTIGPPFSVGVGGNCDGSALPGAVLTCVHTVTNTGFSSDTYVITTLSPLGWSTAIAPAILFLTPGASQAVTITLAVPSTADAGLRHVLTFNARSTALLNVSQSVTDTTIVQQVAGVSFSPSRITPTIGGQLIQFQHDVLNTGNGLDSYTITATQTLNWNITIVPTTTNGLPRGTYQTIQVSIQVPPGAPTVVSNRITLRATSKLTPAVFGQLEDVIGSPQNVGQRWNVTYLPIQWRT